MFAVIIIADYEESMYGKETNYKFFPFRQYHTPQWLLRQGKVTQERSPLTRGGFQELLLPEGLTVGALIHGGIHLMGANQNFVQRAVVLVLTVMGTLLDGAFNRLIGMTIHKIASF